MEKSVQFQSNAMLSARLSVGLKQKVTRSSSLRYETTHRPRFRPKCKRPVSTFAQNILPQSLFHRFTAILSERLVDAESSPVAIPYNSKLNGDVGSVVIPQLPRTTLSYTPGWISR